MSAIGLIVDANPRTVRRPLPGWLRARRLRAARVLPRAASSRSWRRYPGPSERRDSPADLHPYSRRSEASDWKIARRRGCKHHRRLPSSRCQCGLRVHARMFLSRPRDLRLQLRARHTRLLPRHNPPDARSAGGRQHGVMVPQRFSWPQNGRECSPEPKSSMATSSRGGNRSNGETFKTFRKSYEPAVYPRITNVRVPTTRP